MILDRRLSLDEQVVSVDMRVQLMPDVCELFVNDCHYGGAARCAGEEALRKLEEVHSIALQALYGHWTVREMNQALARLRAVSDDA